MSFGVDREDRQRQAEALLDVLDQASLLPIGVLWATQRDQNVIGLELGDGIGEDGQDTATEGISAGVGTDRVQVAEHGVEAPVGGVSKPVGIGHHEQPQDRLDALVWVRVGGFDAAAAHGWLVACGRAGACEGCWCTVHVS